MTQVTLIGINTAKQVFHLVGVDQASRPAAIVDAMTRLWGSSGQEALIDQSTPPRRRI